MGDYPTYAFDGDTAVAFHGSNVIASGTDLSKVAETADQYFESLRSEQKTRAAEHERQAATHITTPNGEKGVILGRTASIFSESITVRFANGQIRHYDTFVGDGLTFTKEASDDAPKSPVEYFQRKLDEAAEPGHKGLTARLEALDEIRRGASHLAGQGVSIADAQALDRIVLTATAERNEVREALDHLAAVDAEAMVPPTRQYVAVEQAALGRSANDNWLEVVAQDMIAESEAEDFDQLLEEGPTTFVSSIEDGAIGNAGIVRQMASEFIHSKTAAYQGEAVESYRERFVAAAEAARRRELSYRKDVAHKEASVKEASVANVPDEALFF